MRRVHFSAMARPSWLRRAVRNRHRHAIDQASRRWRGGHDSDAQRQFDFHTGDLWEQRTERFQTLMTVSGLLFAGAFALAVEGDLPREARDDCAFGSGSDCLKLVTLHYSLLASAFGLHLCVISGCLCITRLFGAVWKSNFRRQTPWTRCGLRSCVYSMAWRFTLTG